MQDGREKQWGLETLHPAVSRCDYESSPRLDKGRRAVFPELNELTALCGIVALRNALRLSAADSKVGKKGFLCMAKK